MIRFLALISAVFWLFGASLAAHAQTEALTESQDTFAPNDGFESPQFQGFLSSDFMERMRREAIQRSMVLHQPDCLELPIFELVSSDPFDTVVMPSGMELPLQGIWVERVATTACEVSVTENMAHTFTDAGQRTFALVRGTTEADLSTQLSLVPAAIEIANTHEYAQECDIVRVADSHVSTRYTRNRWMERWEGSSCGQTIRLDITLTSSSDSTTTYSIRLID